MEAATALAAETHRVRDSLTVKVLRAVVAWQRKAPQAQRLLAEALSLAALGGNARLLADAHPLAVQMGADLQTSSSACVQSPEPDPCLLSGSSPPERTVGRNGLLTAKEAEILDLLSKEMSNKLIARALEISDETVKWHIKNLFFKLAAGTRKHAVDRARILGLLVH